MQIVPNTQLRVWPASWVLALIAVVAVVAVYGGMVSIGDEHGESGVRRGEGK